MWWANLIKDEEKFLKMNGYQRKDHVAKNRYSKSYSKLNPIKQAAVDNLVAAIELEIQDKPNDM